MFWFAVLLHAHAGPLLRPIDRDTKTFVAFVLFVADPSCVLSGSMNAPIDVVRAAA